MKFRPFGRTDLAISELCLGTMQFGWKTDERTSGAILDRFLDSGGNFIQSTCSTGPDAGPDRLIGALSETHVGKWLRSRKVPREDVVLATRVVPLEDALAVTSTRELLREACTDSLRRLGVDHLDLLLCEWNPGLLPMERLLEALWELVRDGLASYVGASGFPVWRMMEAQVGARAAALPRFEAAQADFSLAARQPFETELAGLCRAARMAFLARSPLAGGFLLDVPSRGRTWAPALPDVRRRPYFPSARSFNLHDRLRSVASARGATLAQAALAWVLSHEDVTSAVVGVTTPEQLARLIEATECPMSPAEKRLLEGTVVAGRERELDFVA